MKIKNYYKIKILAFFLVSLCFSNPTFAQTDDKDMVNVKLENVDSDTLENVAYGVQPEWITTSAISSQKGNKLEKSFATSFSNTLFGQIKGLTVMQAGNEAGLDGTDALYSRGLQTFGANKTVLILIDGFESPIDQLIPEEVESVTLLKDAAATAMYGQRGANGVLLVTTKRGSEGPLQVEFQAQYGFETPSYLPEYLGSYDYAGLYNTALMNDGNDPLYGEDALNMYRTGESPYLYPDANWSNELLRQAAPVSKFNLSFKGGSNTVRYYVMLSASSRPGLLLKTGDYQFSDNPKYSQYHIRTNTDVDISETTTLSFDLGFVIGDKENPGAENSWGTFNQIATIPPNAFPVFNPNESWGGTNLYSNPYGDLAETGFFTWNKRTIQSAVRINQNLDALTKGLSLLGAISYNTMFMTHSNKVRNYERYEISEDEDGNLNYIQWSENTSLSAQEGGYDQWRNTTLQLFANYDRKFNEHHVNATLGVNNDAYVIPGGKTPYRHIGLAGRFTYTNREKYIIEASAAYDGANGYASGETFGLFPAVSAGWIISNEEFMKNNSTVNYLKIRTSYGQSGNNFLQENQRFKYANYYGGQGQYYFGTDNNNLGSLGESNIANTQLTWETKTEFNIGLEAQLFDRISFELDYFSQYRKDILTQARVAVPQFLTSSLPTLNAGEVSNKGVEMTISYHNSTESELQFFANLDMWYAKSNIEKYPYQVPQLYDYRYTAGNPVNQPFRLEAIGFFESQSDIDASPFHTFDEVQPGDIKYKDQNGDEVIDSEDMIPVGYGNIPELSFGFNTGLKYKGFYLDLFFHAAVNRSVYLSGKNYYAFQNNGKVTPIALGHWTEETKETATYPRLSADDNLNNYQNSTFWLKNGNFLKLRNAEFGYVFPRKIAEKLKLSDMKLFINGTNLFSIDHVEADPEHVGVGYPNVRFYTIGFKLQF